MTNLDRAFDRWMKRLALPFLAAWLTALFAAGAPTPVFGQGRVVIIPPSRTVATLPSCASGRPPLLYAVTDATSNDTLGAGGGSATAWVVCDPDEEAWEVLTLESTDTGGGSLTAEEGDAGGFAATTLDFGAGFDLTESPAGEANIVLDLTEDQVDLGTEVTGSLPEASVTFATNDGSRHDHVAGDVASGTFADARISSSSVTQHETPLEGVLDLQDLQGAVTDGQVPDTITIAQATLALTGDSATAFFSAGQIEAARGGTGIDSSASTGVARVSSGTWSADATLAHLGASSGQIDDDDLAAGAVDGGSGGEIADGSVTADDLGTNSVGADELASTAIQSGDIETGDLPELAEETWWPAGALSSDGTQCVDGSEVTLASGPKQYTILCADNDGSTIYGGPMRMPVGWDGGTITLTLAYLQSAADTGALASDVAAQCRGAGEAVSSTWGTEIAIDDAAVTGSNGADQTTSAAITPAGTCAAGDLLWWRWQLDATGTTTAVGTLHVLGAGITITRQPTAP